MKFFLAALLATPLAHAAEPLASFDADPAGITVSGVSSGAYMAGQMHVAFSDRIEGAALVAGGPYGCAGGSVAFALQRCMETNLGDPDPAALVAKARGLERAGLIAPLENLSDDPVYVFSGTQDRTLLPEVAASAVAFYRLAGTPEDRLAFKSDLPAGGAERPDDRLRPGGVPARSDRPWPGADRLRLCAARLRGGGLPGARGLSRLPADGGDDRGQVRRRRGLRPLGGDQPADRALSPDRGHRPEPQGLLGLVGL